MRMYRVEGDKLTEYEVSDATDSTVWIVRGGYPQPVGVNNLKGLTFTKSSAVMYAARELQAESLRLKKKGDELMARTLALVALAEREGIPAP